MGRPGRRSAEESKLDSTVMDFALAVGGGLVALLLFLLAVARWSTKTGAEILDWKPARSFETEIALERDEVHQMVEARNERLRRRGRPEVSAAEMVADVDAADRAQRERAARYRAKRAGRVEGAGEALRKQRDAADRFRAERAARRTGGARAAARPTRAQRAARRAGRPIPQRPDPGGPAAGRAAPSEAPVRRPPPSDGASGAPPGPPAGR